jgi:hypothetical protein
MGLDTSAGRQWTGACEITGMKTATEVQEIKDAIDTTTLDGDRLLVVLLELIDVVRKLQ